MKEVMPTQLTPFADIMRRAVEATPGAIGGAFADAEGEMVDGYTTIDREEWAILTAHYGVVLVQLHGAFGTWHYGGPEYFIAQHQRLDVVVHSVAHGYYALLAMTERDGTAPLATALSSLRAAAAELKREIA
ncbi:MAG: hypothetical protein ACKV2T_02625 [Kofleriaceae bacterium]